MCESVIPSKTVVEVVTGLDVVVVFRIQLLLRRQHSIQASRLNAVNVLDMPLLMLL